MKPIVCAITGKLLEPGDPIVNIPGTNEFYGVKTRALPLLTPEKRQEIEARYRPLGGSDAPSALPDPSEEN